MNKSEIESTLKQIEQLKAASPEQSETAEYWINIISERQRFLDDRSYNIVFVGTVGVGKSSLIGVAANLLIDGKPTDKTSLKNKSVLSIGSGRTTVCEVCIRSPKADENGELGLLIDPVSIDEMQKEIAIYAESEWYRRKSNTLPAESEDTEPTPQEIQRVIRNMTGYAERLEPYFEGKKKKLRTVRPLDEVISRFDTLEEFSDHLIKRARLIDRIGTDWWDDCNPENLKTLKTLFENINQGKQEDAMLPRRMDVVVPESYLNWGSGLELTLIDTRGLDSPVESRGDLYNYLINQRSVIVLCSPFRDAPGESLRSLLYNMTVNAELRQTISRILLVLIDQGDASQVNGADGDQGFGQDLKIEECRRALESGGLPEEIHRDATIIAFDVLQDDPKRLRAAIDNSLSQLRKRAGDELNEWINDAQQFVKSAGDALRPELCNTVDKQIKEIMLKYPLSSESPLHDPLAGLYAAISETRYASVVYASCRCNGDYYNLNLYAAVRAMASQEATRWIDELIERIIAKLQELKQEKSFGLVQDYLSLRLFQYNIARINVIQDYAARIENQVREKLTNDPVWDKCAREWGRGRGFKDRVVNHLQEWGRRQQFTAHETTNAREAIPLLEEVSSPPQSPQFRLHVRNLRALKQVDWTPSQLSVVIGANGAGKTTLLLALKLLRVAYERGLPEAVTQVLGGSSNIRTWGSDEAEPIEIGIDIDAASWRIQLVPHEGTAAYQTNEFLSEKERIIFFRDALGTFSYAGEQIIVSDSKLGLRTLMDRGVHEPALRKIASFLQCIAVYHDPDLWTMRHQGSNTSEDRTLHSRGGNALTLLRRWYQERAIHQHRYRFVVDGLAAAFPNLIEDMEFAEAGNTLVARTYRPGQELPCPLANEANGVLQLLVLLCNVASAEKESVVAIDEPENSLHPYALRAFLRRTVRWARQHKLTVVLATHSTVILDEFSASPEQVFVMKTDKPEDTLPVRLDELCNREWLEGFKLGDLYEQGEIGSNEDEV
jgi:predicted ATPase